MVCFNQVDMDTSGDSKTIGSAVAVVAGSSLPRGAYCGPIPELDVTALHFRDENAHDITEIQVVSCDGRLMSQKLDSDWIRYLQASRDMFEQNLELYKSREGQVCIRTTRDICKGEQLTVWFEEVYGREMAVPYLTPFNIKGIQTYVCSRCEKSFPYPNQLKLHMMRSSCHNTPRDTYNRRDWSAPGADSKNYSKTDHYLNEKLQYKSEHVNNLKPSIGEFIRFNLKKSFTDRYNGPSESHMCSSANHIERTSPLASINCHVTYSAPKHAFNPYQLEASVNIIPTHKIHPRDINRNLPNGDHMNSSLPKKSCKIERTLPESDEEPIDMLHKSFIEFSTKSGHRCVYCGKFYSRKYGLKIHLRTHTGYKPLKCKVCLRAFGDPSNLNKHIRLHSECDTPYKCPYCGKLLVRRRDLVRHLNSRHPDKVQQDSKIKVFA